MAKSLVRIAVAGAGIATALSLTAASPALANIKSPPLTDQHVSFPGGKGTMSYIDDGDQFSVCDTKADAYEMVGMVESYHAGTLLILRDSTDAGCEWGGYDVGINAVRLALTWEGGGGTIRSGYFNE